MTTPDIFHNYKCSNLLSSHTQDTYLDAKTNMLRTGHQDREIAALKKELQSMGTEKINSVKNLISYYYKSRK